MKRATHDPRLRARVVSRQPLLYGAGPSRDLDRPAHVRAGSAVTRFGGRLAIVQDDTSFVALVEPATAHIEAIPLPAGPSGVRQFDEQRGNKKEKLDLEAAFVVATPNGPRLVALGSGSTSRRERIVILDSTGTASLIDAHTLYASWRENREFSGSELNIEGAAVTDGELVLFQRGNGAPKDGIEAVNATARVGLRAFLDHLDDPTCGVPVLKEVERWDLGAVGGVRFTFTDGASDAETLFYLAAAEDSPDTYHDGPVTGVAIGALDANGGRYAILEDSSGKPFLGKAEGLVLDGAHNAWIVLDLDDPKAPSELCRVELSGRFRGA